MKAIFKVAATLAAMLCVHVALAETVVVIVNAANTQAATLKEVKSIYQDKTIVWGNGEKVAVYNLPSKDEAAEIFASKVLGLTAQAAATAEASRVISNRSRNLQLTRRDTLVISIVARSPNAIGYVPKKLVEGRSGVRVLFSLEK